MTKRILILFVCFCFCLAMLAQNAPAKTSTPNSFCNSITKIRAQVGDKFKKIRLGEQKSFYNSKEHFINYEVGYGYKASIIIPGALSCFIEDNEGQIINIPTEYKAFFGTFNTLALATKKLEPIKNQLLTCLPGFEVANRPIEFESFGYPARYEFKEDRTDNSSPQKISLYIYKRYDINREAPNFTVYLTIEANLNENKKNDFVHVDTFCQKLKEIMKHAYTNFAEINTGEAQQPFYTEPNGFEEAEPWAAKASLELPGAKQSSVVIRTYFSAFFGTYTKSEAIKKADSIKTKLMACLANYKMKSDPFGTFPARYIFTEAGKGKSSPQEIELFADKCCAADIYRVTISINGLKE